MNNVDNYINKTLERIDNVLIDILDLNESPKLIYRDLVKKIFESLNSFDKKRILLNKILQCQEELPKIAFALKLILNRCLAVDKCELEKELEDIGIKIRTENIYDRCPIFFAISIWLPDILYNYFSKNINIETIKDTINNLKKEIDSLKERSEKESVDIEKITLSTKMKDLGIISISKRLLRYIDYYLNNEVLYKIRKFETSLNDLINNLVNINVSIEKILNKDTSLIYSNTLLNNLLKIKEEYDNITNDLSNISKLLIDLKTLFDIFIDIDEFTRYKDELATIFQLIMKINPNIYERDFILVTVSTSIFDELEKDLKKIRVDDELVKTIGDLKDRFMKFMEECIMMPVSEIFY